MGFKLVKKKTSTKDLCVLDVSGDITICEIGEFKENIMSRIGNCRDLELDLKKVEDFDSTGGQILISLAKGYLNKGHSFVITGLSPSVENYMKTMGFFNSPLFGKNDG